MGDPRGLRGSEFRQELPPFGDEGFEDSIASLKEAEESCK